MTRHRLHPSGLRRTVVATLAMATTLVVAACNSEPAASPLTDPTAILQAAATQTAGATVRSS